MWLSSLWVPAALQTARRSTIDHAVRALSTHDAASSLLDRLINHEQRGVPTNAGTNTNQGFDLVCVRSPPQSLPPQLPPQQRVHQLLALMGNPHKHTRVVHVAGTKGKGSVSTCIAHICQAAGYRTGSYTRCAQTIHCSQNMCYHLVCSPHVTTLRERIQVDGRPIQSDDWEATIAQHAPAIERVAKQHDGALSHFEVVTALALQHFRDQQVGTLQWKYPFLGVLRFQ